MRVLVVGANGFIGTAVVTALHAAGHETRCIVRSSTKFARRFPGCGVESLDLTSKAARNADHWSSLLEDIDAVVYVAGVLQPRRSQVAWNVHRDAPNALYTACENRGVQRVIHVSATGVTESQTTYSRTKLAGEECLIGKDLDWTILRPVLVVGDGSYGGTSMIRALAVSPIVTPVIGDGSIPLGIIHKNDLAAGIVELLQTKAGDKTVLEPSAAEELPMDAVVTAYRRWFGLPKRPVLGIPNWIAAVLGRIGDLFHLDPINSTAVAQFRSTMTGNASQYEQVTGVKPVNLAEILASRPAESQDLWHARLFLLRPLIRMCLALLWLISGIAGLFGTSYLYQLVIGQLVPGNWVASISIVASSINLAIGASLLFGLFLRFMAWVQIGLVLAFTVGLGLLVPSLWADPYAGLLKNLPILVLLLVHLVVEQER
ncbi:MAG: SDR family oxidoreductase [Gammaproteobacteria bacterium]|nr:SDR family oxidoreductase [Gammaproteobacteria bacterium]